MEEAIVEMGADHLDTVSQHERLLELPRGDAAMQEDAFTGFIVLPATSTVREGATRK